MAYQHRRRRGIGINLPAGTFFYSPQNFPTAPAPTGGGLPPATSSPFVFKPPPVLATPGGPPVPQTPVPVVYMPPPPPTSVATTDQFQPYIAPAPAGPSGSGAAPPSLDTSGGGGGGGETGAPSSGASMSFVIAAVAVGLLAFGARKRSR